MKMTKEGVTVNKMPNLKINLINSPEEIKFT